MCESTRETGVLRASSGSVCARSLFDTHTGNGPGATATALADAGEAEPAALGAAGANWDVLEPESHRPWGPFPCHAVSPTLPACFCSSPSLVGSLGCSSTWSDRGSEPSGTAALDHPQEMGFLFLFFVRHVFTLRNTILRVQTDTRTLP